MGTRRRMVIAIGAGLAAGVLGTLGAVVILDGDGGAPAPVSAVPADPGVAGELLTLLEQGRGKTFHARYQATSSDAAVASQQLTLELWQKPQRQRQDVIISASGTSGRSAGFVSESGAVSCTQEGAADRPWSCRTVPGPAETGPTALVKQLTSQVAGQQVTVHDDRIAGEQVRCFGLPLGTATAEVCVTGQGVPARVSSGASRFELVELSAEVSDDIFTPPAPV